MKRFFWRYILCLAAATLAPANVYAQTTNAKNTFSIVTQSGTRFATIEDSIGMTKIGTPMDEATDQQPAVFSPRRDQFVITTRRGNIRENTNDYSLLLFHSGDVFRGAKPELLARMKSSSSRPGIQDVEWQADGRAVLFIGAEQDDKQQLYRCDIESRKLTKITNHPTDVVAFSTSSDGDTFVFLARPPEMAAFDKEFHDHGLVVTNQSPTQLLTGQSISDPLGVVYPLQLYFSSSKTTSPEHIPLPNLLPEALATTLALSPTRKQALFSSNIVVPRSWKGYKDPGLNSLSGGGSQYFIVDTETHRFRAAVDAPNLSWKKPSGFWLSDGRSIVLTRTFLPLDVPDEKERLRRESQQFTVEVDVDSGKITKIAEGELDIVSFDANTKVLLLQSRPLSSPYNPGNINAYRKTADSWVHLENTNGNYKEGESLDVKLEQDMNTPPTITAMTSSGRRVVLLDPNPGFRTIEFGKVSEIRWEAKDGHEVKGGLYLPPDFIRGKRYPLVIQTHGWDPRKFWMDGASAAGYAAQALAGRGFVVAQTEDNTPPEDGETVREGPTNMATFEGLIDFLDERGTIDRGRVGLLGWSRTGYHVRYTLTFSKYPFAAAVIADGLDGSYVQYESWLNVFPEIQVPLNGPPPFGTGLASWIKKATGFNLDKVNTPVRLLGFRPQSLLNNWEWFVNLRYLKKPVELVWMPDAEHDPIRPSERMVAQQGTVDWFCFWLKGEEDSDPRKSNQYARWHDLKKLNTTALIGNAPN